MPEQKTMLNKLKRCYYKVSTLPGMSLLAARIAPGLKKLLEKLENRKVLPSQVVALEKRLTEQRQRLNHVLAQLPDFRESCPEISVIINTCNRARDLGDALDSVLAQSYPIYEVIVVNGPSTDNTGELLQKYANRIKILSCPEQNLSMSRNIGIGAAGGEIVAFTDDDAIAAPDWLMELSRCYADRTIAAAGGFIHDRTGIGWQSRICVADRFGDVSYYDNREECFRKEGEPTGWGKEKFFCLTGVNISFRRSALLSIGCFDEIHTCQFDETDVLVRLLDAGYGIEFAENAEVVHKFSANDRRDTDRTPKSLYQQARSKAYFIMRHAAPVYGKDRAKKHVSAYEAWLAANVGEANRKGRISVDDRVRLLSEIRDGAREGLELAAIRDMTP